MPVLALAAAAYVFLNSPAPPEKFKVEGETYALHRDFLINLRDGRSARLSAALVLRPEEDKKETSKEPVGDPPAGYGTLPQEAIVRADITDSLTGFSSDDLISERRRHRIGRSIAARTFQPSV